jgi:hypothetical protein
MKPLMLYVKIENLTQDQQTRRHINYGECVVNTVTLQLGAERVEGIVTANGTLCAFHENYTQLLSKYHIPFYTAP